MSIASMWNERLKHYPHDQNVMFKDLRALVDDALELQRVKAERDRLGHRYQDTWRTLEGVAHWLGLTVEGLGEDPSSAANPLKAERARVARLREALKVIAKGKMHGDLVHPQGEGWEWPDASSVRPAPP